MLAAVLMAAAFPSQQLQTHDQTRAVVLLLRADLTSLLFLSLPRPPLQKHSLFATYLGLSADTLQWLLPYTTAVACDQARGAHTGTKCYVSSLSRLQQNKGLMKFGHLSHLVACV